MYRTASLRAANGTRKNQPLKKATTACTETVRDGARHCTRIVRLLSGPTRMKIFSSPLLTLIRRHALLLGLLIVGAAPAFALELVTEENAPFNYLDSKQHVSGISTEILQEL